MDRASFELIGNVGKLEIKPIRNDKRLAIISIATSEGWKAESGDWNEKTYWHRVVVFAPAKVALIEKAVMVGTRLRLVGQVRPNSWEDNSGNTRYSIEFVISGLGEVEILARGKPKPEAASEEASTGEAAPKAKRKRAA
ncbi:MAG: single-stranded DNA-binding family protein [Pseudomonadota bacterium]|jgi:single-strand DNA-binding protein